MPEREVSAGKILMDLRSGLDGAALREKYKLSRRGLEHLFHQLEAAGLLKQLRDQASDPRRIRIRTVEVVADICCGMGSSELRKKYGLTPWGVQQALKKLVDAGAITLDGLCQELKLRYEAVCPDDVRESRRYYLDFEVACYEKARPEIVGSVRDLTRTGLGATGIEAEVDEAKTLILAPKGLSPDGEVGLQAKCLWARRDGTDGEWLTGFQVAPITTQDRQGLTRLLRAVTFGD